jgi:hypothetical protein
MHNKIRIYRGCPNDIEQPCGSIRWQAMCDIADVNKTYGIHAHLFKSLLYATRNGTEFSVGVSSAGLASV